MGFLSSLFSTALKNASEFKEDVKEHKNRLGNYSKEELMDSFKSPFSSTAKKVAIAKTMKEKGWR